jgi:SOS-response transcriptional repressor LexA
MLVDALMGRTLPRALVGRPRHARPLFGPALTDRQGEVLVFIAWHLDHEGVPPTLREIAGFLGISSTNGSNDHLEALVRKGYLERTPLRSRGIRLTALGLLWLRRKER